MRNFQVKIISLGNFFKSDIDKISTRNNYYRPVSHILLIERSLSTPLTHVDDSFFAEKERAGERTRAEEFFFFTQTYAIQHVFSFSCNLFVQRSYVVCSLPFSFILSPFTQYLSMWIVGM
jgi:hypothetical protein